MIVLLQGSRKCSGSRFLGMRYRGITESLGLEANLGEVVQGLYKALQGMPLADLGSMSTARRCFLTIFGGAWIQRVVSNPGLRIWVYLLP